MNQKYLIPIFYSSIFLVVASALTHVLLDPPEGIADIASTVLFLASIGILVGMTVFFFRPKIQQSLDTLSMMKLLKNAATAANEATSVEEGLQSALDNLCAYTGWPVGHAYVFSTEKNALISTGVWHMKDAQKYAQFKRVSQEEAFIAGECFIGEVFADATPMWILDVADASVYRRKETAIAAGLKAAFAFPILVGKKVAAVIEFYDSESKIPDEDLLSVMGNVGKQLGQIFERAEFQERAQLLETVIASANDAVIITKANLDNPGPEILYVNEAFTRISGYSAEEVIGKCPRFLQGEFTKRETLDALGAALRKGKPFKDELLNYSKDGKPYWLEISIVPVKNAQGVITHFAALERDISERKKADAEYKNAMIQLKRANLKAEAASRDLEVSLRKAEEANKAKSDFLANMSHELRTPMNGVLGMAQLLTDTPLNDEQSECVNTINGSAENLLMLLNDILDFSKIEAGALQLENIAFALKDTIASTTNLLRPQADKKHVDLRLDIDPALPSYVWGDSGRLRQIITNLLGNSIKFTLEGHVRLSAKIQEQESGDALLHISVEDTGIGIPADKIDQIFEKFTQADGSVTRKFGGTGLGLAITKQLVSLMGGTIGVESAEGKGSTFWFTIPITAATEGDVKTQSDNYQSQHRAKENRMPIGKAKALLVEDYPVNQVFAQKLLKKFGFVDLDLAENGVEAIEKYRTNTYDIIFMDCQMPELDGYQTTQKLRLLEDGTPLHTPIIAMTANAMMGDREKCLKAGMDDYISKPLRAEHLKNALQNWFVLDEDKAAISLAITQSNLPVDLAQLRLFTDGDPAEEKILADMFLEQAEEMIQILTASTAEDKNDVWKSAAHRFKGSSGNLGATQLHHLCKRAEIHFEDPEPKKLEMLTAIKLETQKVKEFFLAQNL